MEEDRMHAIICDIDNCFVDSREWHKHIPEDNTDRAGWDRFLEQIHLCKPNRAVIDYVCATAEILPIIFITGREDRKDCRRNTIKQLNEFSRGYVDFYAPNCHHKLLMRSEFDYRPADEVKEEHLIKIVEAGYTPHIAIDDELCNCKLYMRYRIPTIMYDIDTNTFKKCAYDIDIDDLCKFDTL